MAEREEVLEIAVKATIRSASRSQRPAFPLAWLAFLITSPSEKRAPRSTLIEVMIFLSNVTIATEDVVPALSVYYSEAKNCFCSQQLSEEQLMTIAVDMKKIIANVEKANVDSHGRINYKDAAMAIATARKTRKITQQTVRT